MRRAAREGAALSRRLATPTQPLFGPAGFGGDEGSREAKAFPAKAARPRAASGIGTLP
jgi:hypothetical protein